ncbi:hypothetical protein [Streptomyces sp. H39-C1]|uniref:hypothetical protein n=1 Tax=Streptomyces sp. H39-C1 TaxID=3004355 RepID=UPI0022AF45CE|nr:hypothetical protein [Streptomyces sp. H39-C1]MCZ4099867.1 hypothetical protein [Streptomyces sp. H39-C1]
MTAHDIQMMLLGADITTLVYLAVWLTRSELDVRRADRARARVLAGLRGRLDAATAKVDEGAQ